MTEKQIKTLIYAGFTKVQITALESVFNVLPPPDRRAEIDGFVERTVEKMREIEAHEKEATDRVHKTYEEGRGKFKPPTP